MLKLTSLQTIFLSEIILVLLIIMGIVPQEFSYLVLILLIISFIKLSLLNSLKLFILSIPFFVALPTNPFSDSMSIWRILIIVLFLKMIWEKYKDYHSNKSCYPEFISGSASGKGLMHFQSIKQGIKKINRNNCDMQRTLKQFQNDNYYKLFLLVILFFVIIFLSLIFSQSPFVGIKKALFLLNIFLLFPIIIFVVKQERDLIEILKTVLYSSSIILFIGYFQLIVTFFTSLFQFWKFWDKDVIKAFYGQNLSYLLNYSNTWFSYYSASPPTLRMFSVLPDSHSFAMIIIISIPIIMSFLFFENYSEIRIIKKKYLLILLLFSFMAIFFSGSRGAWVGSIFALMAGLFLFLVSSLKERNLLASSIKKIQKSEIISEFIKLLKSNVNFNFNLENNSKYYSRLIIFSVLLFFILMPVSSLILKQNQEIQILKSNFSLNNYNRNNFSLFERAFSISDFNEKSNKGRIQIWEETITSIERYPLLGVGFGNFNYVLGEKSSDLKRGSSAHSIYFNITAEIGIFGLIIFLLLIIEILKMSYRLYFSSEKKYLKIFTGSFFVYFIWICAYGIFDVVIFNDKVLMMVVILIGILYSAETEQVHKHFKFSERKYTNRI